MWDDSGFVVWLTGLPGSGKTTIARELGGMLKEKGLRVEILDGDEVRKNLHPSLGFSKEDRMLHIKRVIYVSKLLERNGVGVIVSLISPYREIRDYARKEVRRFVEVFVKCSLKTCMERDPKKLYARALKGEIKDLTGLQDVYEEPLSPELVLDTEAGGPRESAAAIMHRLEELGCFANAPSSD